MRIVFEHTHTLIPPTVWPLQGGRTANSSQVAESRRRESPGVRSRWLTDDDDPFIVVTSGDKVDEETRRRIRSRVMRGKNKRREPTPTSAEVLEYKDHRLSLSTDPARSSHTQNLFATDGLKPPTALSVLSTIRFADGKAHKEHMHLFHEFYTVIKHESYIIDGCMSFDKGQQPSHLEYLATDAAYMHCILFVTATWCDWIKGQTSFGQDSLRHLARTLTYLQQNIGDVRLATSESTITVVILLAITASAMGDEDAVVNHWAGLHKMVRLRGGLKSLTRYGRLGSRACRLDIAVSLHTGQKPLFFPDTLSWRPYLAIRQTTAQRTPIHALLPYADICLVHIWTDMQEFCRATNTSFSTGSKLDPIVFHQALASIQYRLLHLDYTTVGGDVTHEALRLCMLTFGTTVFLQVQAERNYDALAARLEAAILALKRPGTEAGRALMLWMLVVASMLVFDKADTDGLWLAECAEKLVSQDMFESWASAKVALRSALWVDSMHDERGEVIYKRLFHRQPCLS